MATKETIFWIYRGYAGDEFYYNTMRRPDAQSSTHRSLLNILDGKTIIKMRVSYLTQRGFGKGYFNNSGEYAIALKSVVANKEEALLKLQQMRNVYTLDTRDVFATSIAEWKAVEKEMKKLYPF